MDAVTLYLAKKAAKEAGSINIAEESTEEVGGIPVGSTFSNVSLEQFVRMLLYPELWSTITNPSFALNISPSHTNRQYIGDTIEYTMDAALNPGSINPQYPPTLNNFRAGAAQEFRFIIKGGLPVEFPTPTGWAQQYIANMAITAGNNVIDAQVDHAEGCVVYGSNGTLDPNIAQNPFPAQLNVAHSRTVVGTYPVLATLAGGGRSFVLYADAVTLRTVIGGILGETANPETGPRAFVLHGEDLVGFPSYRQAFKVAQAWGAVTRIQQYNELSGEFFDVNLSTFTKTTEDIGGVMYDVYTYNDVQSGERALLITF